MRRPESRLQQCDDNSEVLDTGHGEGVAGYSKKKRPRQVKDSISLLEKDVVQRK